MKKRIWIPTLITMISLVTYSSLAIPKQLNYADSNHFNLEKQQFFNTNTKEDSLPPTDAITALWDMWRNEKERAPTQWLPEQKPDWDAFLRNDGENHFIWFGHSNLLIRVQDLTIAIDPVFGKTVDPLHLMMKRYQPSPAQIQEFPSINIVIISHNHYDHLEKSTIKYLAKHSKNTRFIVPLGMATTLQKWGIDSERITELDWWKDIKINNIKITATEAQHTSGRGLMDGNKSLWAGWIIQDPKQTIFYSGDNGYGKHYAEIGKRYPNIDIAFIENGQYDAKWATVHMNPAQTAQAALDLKTKNFVPVHWGAYSMALHKWNEPVLKSVPLVQAYGIRTLTPLMGQVFNINTQTKEWYKDIK